jgi:hypothetical protein
MIGSTGSISRCLREAATRRNHSQWSPTTSQAAAAGPRWPERRGTAARRMRPHSSHCVSARLAARWLSPSARRTSGSLSGLPWASMYPWTVAVDGATPHAAPISPHARANERRISSTAGSELVSGITGYLTVAGSSGILARAH